MKFKILTLLMLVVVIAVTTSFVNWYTCDTILHSELNSYITLPSGRRISTNRWFRAGELRNISFLSNGNSLFIIQDNYGDEVATIMVGKRNVPAIVAKYRVDGPKYRAEYWIVPAQLPGRGRLLGIW